MIYSFKIQKAIDFATKAHQGQKRKGKETPYIVHPLTVALILSRTNAVEDVIVAGILHDTLEDTSLTKEELEKEFGKRVFKIVDDVTEQDKSLPWTERKRLALEHIKQMSEDSLLVKSADVLHNMTDQINDYLVEGDKIFERFNAPKNKQLERYKNLIAEIKRAWIENPLLPDLEENLEVLVKKWS